jgi:hypothetical protein
MVRIPSAGEFAIAACLAACGGGGVEGHYIGRPEAFFDSLTFKPDGTVDVVLVGVRHEGRFTADRDGVTLTAPGGEESRLTLESSGCLTHRFVGTYCRDGAGLKASANGRTDASGLAPAYEARTPEGRIRLDFGAAGKVRFTMITSQGTHGSGHLSFEVPYARIGDKIEVRLPDDERLLLVRRGRDLEGTFNGDSLRFVGQP